MERLTGADVRERVWAVSGREELSSSDWSGDEEFKSEEMSQDVLSSEDQIQSDGDKSKEENAGAAPKQQRQQRPAANPDRRWVRANLPPPPNIPFTGQPGIQVNTAGFEPIYVLKLFTDDELVIILSLRKTHLLNTLFITCLRSSKRCTHRAQRCALMNHFYCGKGEYN